MEHQDREEEMRYKDLRGRFLGMILGCAIGEIVAREELVYKTLDDDEPERMTTELPDAPPHVAPSFEPGELTRLLVGVCETLPQMTERLKSGSKASPRKAETGEVACSRAEPETGISCSQENAFPRVACRANQLFLKAAPLSFLAELLAMDVGRTASLVVQALLPTHKSPIAVLPPTEWVLMTRSALQKRAEVSFARERLEIWLNTEMNTQNAWADAYDLKEYLRLREEPLEKTRPVSGLYLLKLVMEKVLELAPGEERKKTPPFDVGMDRLIENKDLLKPCDRPAAGALAGAFLGVSLGIGGIPPAYRKRMANTDEYHRLGQSWFEVLWSARAKQDAPKNRPVKKEEAFSPVHFYLAHRDSEEMKTVFHTVVVRNKALKAMYPGGISAYHRKYKPFANRDICVTCHMGSDVDDNIEDLLICGLMPRDDFVCFDGTVIFPPEDGQTWDMGVSWLSGRYRGGYLWVKYEKPRKSGKWIPQNVKGV